MSPAWRPWEILGSADLFGLLQDQIERLPEGRSQAGHPSQLEFDSFVI